MKPAPRTQCCEQRWNRCSPLMPRRALSRKILGRLRWPMLVASPKPSDRIAWCDDWVSAEWAKSGWRNRPSPYYGESR